MWICGTKKVGHRCMWLQWMVTTESLNYLSTTKQMPTLPRMTVKLHFMSLHGMVILGLKTTHNVHLKVAINEKWHFQNQWAQCNDVFFINAGHQKIVEILIKSGANINLKVNKDITPLNLAALHGKFKFKWWKFNC